MMMTMIDGELKMNITGLDTYPHRSVCRHIWTNSSHIRYSESSRLYR